MPNLIDTVNKILTEMAQLEDMSPSDRTYFTSGLIVGIINASTHFSKAYTSDNPLAMMFLLKEVDTIAKSFRNQLLQVQADAQTTTRTE